MSMIVVMHTPKHYETPGPYEAGLVWFRRDLRANDNAALSFATKACKRVYCVFVFDREILDTLPKADRRVEFIWQAAGALDGKLQSLGGGLEILHAHASQAIAPLAQLLGVSAVFTNHDYEPAAKARDETVGTALEVAGIAFHSYKDQVIFEHDEVLTQSEGVFSVFTPYKNAWLKRLQTDEAFYLSAYPTLPKRLARRPDQERTSLPSLSELGFEPTNLSKLGIVGNSAAALALVDDFENRMDQYDEARNFPAIKGVSYLSVHLRFGTVSIRQLARRARERMRNGSPGAQTWLSELVWRDFYFQILSHHPRVVSAAFKPDYDRIVWAKDPAALQAWREGRTGYPLVDAAMKQLNTSGYMHNRLRMVVASFLTKDLGLDWREGEAYFALKLNDFDLAANNGGWQWAASSGCDAQPYFRVFNPVSQSEKFDAAGRFIRRYLPELSELSDKDIHAPWLASPLALQAAGVTLDKTYPRPIVAHDTARAQTLARYAVVKKPLG